MTIPGKIKAAYLAVAAGSKPHEREAARAIVWAVAGWLETEFRLSKTTTYSDVPESGWLQEAFRRLSEETKK